MAALDRRFRGRRLARLFGGSRPTCRQLDTRNQAKVASAARSPRSNVTKLLARWRRDTCSVRKVQAHLGGLKGEEGSGYKRIMSSLSEGRVARSTGATATSRTFRWSATTATPA